MPYVMDEGYSTVGDLAAPPQCAPGQYVEFRTNVCKDCPPGTAPNLKYPGSSSTPCKAIPGYVPPAQPSVPAGVAPPGVAPVGPGVGPVAPAGGTPGAPEPWFQTYKWYILGGVVLLVGAGVAYSMLRRKSAPALPTPAVTGASPVCGVEGRTMPTLKVRKRSVYSRDVEHAEKAIRRIESGLRCGKSGVTVEVLKGKDAGLVVSARVCRDPQSPTGASVSFYNPLAPYPIIETLPFGRRGDWSAWAATARGRS